MDSLIRISDCVWEIPRSGEMNVPGRIVASESLIAGIRDDQTLTQVKNVAQLPGILQYSMAMPDAHMGYGFPIGGVAAMDVEHGVISPGGVGYDINCGVRLMKTNLTLEDIKGRVEDLVVRLFSRIPTGVGSSGAIKKLTVKELEKVLVEGAPAAIKMGFGLNGDLEMTEDGGSIPDADPGAVSERAKERGRPQLGTLGSGNHFVEISYVETIFQPGTASVFGMFEGQVCILIHSGSRGLGYQVCDDYLKLLGQAVRSYGLDLPDRQLVCVPIRSPEGQTYHRAMAAAANFAWANRQILMDLTREALYQGLGIPPATLGCSLLYDVAHNIVKFEEHEVNGMNKRVAVHRKGATRAFGPGRQEVPELYRDVGQPVLLPGDMGSGSYVMVGTGTAMQNTFGSSAHGAGRVLSRSGAIKTGKGRDIKLELKSRGIHVIAAGRKTLMEERPEAYKNIDEVSMVTEKAGISNRVARLRPLGVIKG